MPFSRIYVPQHIDTDTERIRAFRAALQSFMAEGSFSLFPPISDSAAWSAAFAASKAPAPSINDDPCAALLEILAAECAERKGRHVARLCDAIHAELDSSKWRADNRGGAAPAFLQTAALLVDILNIFGDNLPSKTRNAISSAAIRHVAEPFIETANGRRLAEPWLLRKTSANAIGCSCTLRTILGLDIPRDDKIAASALVLDRISNYIAGFCDDGITPDGANQWHDGFLQFTLLAETMRLATAGRLDMLADPDAAIAARQPVVTAMHRAVTPTFANTSAAFDDVHSPLVAWLNTRMGWGLSLETHAPQPASALWALFAFHAPHFPVLFDPVSDLVSRDSTFLNDSGVFITRARNCPVPFALAIKGGDNDDERNHYDVGSYCILHGASWLAADPGVSRADVQSAADPLRSSYAHSVPRIANGILQSAGREFKGEVLKCRLTDAMDLYRLDMTHAYDCLQLVSLVRTVTSRRIASSASITVEDSFEFSSPRDFETALVTYATVERTSSNTITLRRAGEDDFTVGISASAPWEMAQETIGCGAGGTSPVRVAFRLLEPSLGGFIRLDYSV